MSGILSLTKKITELEKRVAEIENKLSGLTDNPGKDPFYEIAKELVIKHNKASVMFLQLKMLIDFERAKKIMEELERDGVVSRENDGNPRKILVNKL